MAVEEHRLFPVWKKRLEELIDAKDALRKGNASQVDVDKAQAEYDKIADEI